MTQPEGTVPYAKCHCYFCRSAMVHPTRHEEYARISSRLLVAESLDPEDRVKQWACTTCGHTVEDLKGGTTDCYHPLSCRLCDYKGAACGNHQVGESGHKWCTGTAVPHQ